MKTSIRSEKSIAAITFVNTLSQPYFEWNLKNLLAFIVLAMKPRWFSLTTVSISTSSSLLVFCFYEVAGYS